jgi:nitrite reductase/ring-hydroxylating ferredoxin subunit
MSKAAETEPSAIALDGRRYDVGGVDEFPPDTRRVIRIDKRAIGIINAGGTLYAVLDVCPHELVAICEHGVVSGTTLPSSRPGEIEFGLENRVLRCPWHGYEFDLKSGNALFTHFRGRLRTFDVEVLDGRVVVDLRTRSAPVGG